MWESCFIFEFSAFFPLFYLVYYRENTDNFEIDQTLRVSILNQDKLRKALTFKRDSKSDSVRDSDVWACDVDVDSGSDSNSDGTENITATMTERDRQGKRKRETEKKIVVWTGRALVVSLSLAAHTRRLVAGTCRRDLSLSMYTLENWPICGTIGPCD